MFSCLSWLAVLGIAVITSWYSSLWLLFKFESDWDQIGLARDFPKWSVGGWDAENKG